jgi:hypothetical protein
MRFFITIDLPFSVVIDLIPQTISNARDGGAGVVVHRYWLLSDWKQKIVLGGDGAVETHPVVWIFDLGLICCR